MRGNAIANARLITQEISEKSFISAEGVVAWMGAMQAQDFRMAKWAVGVRMKNGTDSLIEEAINNGEILRTHVLRPTLHFVSADDIRWMLQLSASRLKSSMKGRLKELELDHNILKKSYRILERLLKEGNHLSRKELMKEFTNCGIATDNNRASHILMSAELEQIICSGKMKGAETSYALLDEIVPRKTQFDKEEALFRLSSIYFRSRSPAMLDDFRWWSGLSLKDGKVALALIEKNFFVEKINGKEFILPHSFPFPPIRKTLFLLPAFDEFLISYKDRSASVPKQHATKAFSNNGIFWPTVIENGKLAGIWKRELKKDKTIISFNFFNPINKATCSQLQKEAERFGNFLNLPVQLEK